MRKLPRHIFWAIAVLLGTAVLNAQNPVAPNGPVPGYQGMTSKQRGLWFVKSTVGAESLLLAGPWSAGWGVLTDTPEEYPRNWEGFGQRYGMRLTGVATSNAMESALGALWGEDPRYFRMGSSAPFKSRVKHVIITTFTAPRRDGRYAPAYGRYAAYVGSNFASNLWRVESSADWQTALGRVATGFGGRVTGHAFSEFWPDIKQVVFKRP